MKFASPPNAKPIAYGLLASVNGDGEKAALNRPSALLSHLNEAVLPIYVLHQPILLIAAYWLFPLHLPVVVEAATLAAITAIGSVGVYEIAIRPLAPMRFLFGLKGKASRASAAGASAAPSPENAA